MREIYVYKGDATASSCVSGRYFVRKMFQIYGFGHQHIKLSLSLLKTIVKEFELYMETTTIEDLKMCGTEVHIRCYLDCLIETVPKRANLSNIGSSDAWDIARRSSQSTIILSGFWKELKRIS